MAFLRPKKNLAPNFATFKVPLQFNKLDMRDYLWNVYNVKVLSVRSMVNQQAPSSKGGIRGQTYRPRAEKLMLVELDSPFVWPEAPAESERSAFDYDMWKRTDNEREDQMKLRQNMISARIPLRTEEAPSAERSALASEAQALLEGRKEWKSSSIRAADAGAAAAAETELASPVAGQRDATGGVIVEDDKQADPRR